MHAVIVKVSIVESERADAELRERIVPMVSQLPGFVAGYWLALEDGKGGSLVVFESEEAAGRMVAGIKAQQEQGGMPVTFDSVTTREVVASA
jgi:hypothetical protein